MERRDIQTRADIEDLVREFYHRAFAEPVLGHLFTEVAHMDLEAHMPIMCDFWQTVLFQAGLYRRNAFSVHLDLHHKESLTPDHFNRWLTLWTATVDDLYTGPIADRAKNQAILIGRSIHRRLERTVDGELIRMSPHRN